MKLSVKTTLIITILFIFNAHISSQTIHRDDLKYFVGAFPVENHLKKTDTLNFTEFSRWDIVYPDSNGIRHLYELTKPSDNLHLVMFSSPQNGKVVPVLINFYGNIEYNYEFYILMDVHGFELQRNIITVWQKKGVDSLKFISGTYGHFNSCIGYSSVENVSMFPDASYMICIKKAGEDGKIYSFFRTTDFKNYEGFYNSSINNIHYNFQSMENLNYTVTEQKDFAHMKDRKIIAFGRELNLVQKIIDSTYFQPIDLWELTKKHFNIVEP